ncbi:MAG: hypothetical protein H7A32_00685 [Deltaproteobacteria bacterium]|nr:hypothetical protein [Deltaproteobacteria bacterium]
MGAEDNKTGLNLSNTFMGIANTLRDSVRRVADLATGSSDSSIAQCSEASAQSSSGNSPSSEYSSQDPLSTAYRQVKAWALDKQAPKNPLLTSRFVKTETIDMGYPNAACDNQNLCKVEVTAEALKGLSPSEIESICQDGTNGIGLPAGFDIDNLQKALARYYNPQSYQVSLDKLFSGKELKKIQAYQKQIQLKIMKAGEFNPNSPDHIAIDAKLGRDETIALLYLLGVPAEKANQLCQIGPGSTMRTVLLHKDIHGGRIKSAVQFLEKRISEENLDPKSKLRLGYLIINLKGIEGLNDKDGKAKFPSLLSQFEGKNGANPPLLTKPWNAEDPLAGIEGIQASHLCENLAEIAELKSSEAYNLEFYSVGTSLSRNDVEVLSSWVNQKPQDIFRVIEKADNGKTLYALKTGDDSYQTEIFDQVVLQVENKAALAEANGHSKAYQRKLQILANHLKSAQSELKTEISRRDMVDQNRYFTKVVDGLTNGATFILGMGAALGLLQGGRMLVSGARASRAKAKAQQGEKAGRSGEGQEELRPGRKVVEVEGREVTRELPEASEKKYQPLTWGEKAGLLFGLGLMYFVSPGTALQAAAAGTAAKIDYDNGDSMFSLDSLRENPVKHDKNQIY